MKEVIKNGIQNLVKACGYEINSLSNREKHRVDQWAWLENLGIHSVLDIGANTGQFAEFVLNVFPEASIFSFEPLKPEYSEMILNLKNNPRFNAFNIGLSNVNGTQVFFRSSSSPSSSLLSMNELQKEIYPFTAEQTKCVVEISRLDDFIDKSGLQLKPNLLIKMDVQGAEDKVIEGGIETFKQAKVLLTEVSFFCFYKDQPLFKDMIDQLTDLDFVFCGIFEQFCDQKDNLPLFADSFFIKQDLISSILSNAIKI